MSVSPKSVYLAYSQDEGCRFHRILSPARFLKRDLPGVRFCASARGDEWGDHDLYVVHGLPLADTILKMAQHQAAGRRWLWSIDDDYTSIPPWNPCRLPPEKLAAWDVALKTADHVIVSTPGLAATFAGRPEAAKVRVAPNLVDLSLYPTPAPAKWPDERTFTVLWAGSNTHLYDVKPVAKAVAHCLQKYRQVEFVFFGQAPPADLVTDFLHKGVTWQPPVDLGMYWGVLHQIRPHVVLAPLYDCLFNQSKSNIRVLDGWALSAAVVASPVGEYTVVRDGEDGLLAADEDGWVNALERLVEDEPLRHRLATAGRRRCEAEFDWQSPAARRPWTDLYADLLSHTPTPVTA